MNNIMIDLEALNPGRDGILVSLGAVYFDFEKGFGEEFYNEIHLSGLKEQEGRGMTTDLRCIQWWMQQSDGARDVFVPKESQVSFTELLRNFSVFCNKNAKIWANGFDCSFMLNCYRKATLAVPWRRKNERCYRTMKNLFGNRAKLIRVGSHHNGLDDAKTQAQHLIEICRGLHINE